MVHYYKPTVHKFLQGDWQQDEHPRYIVFEGIIVDMICKIDSSYHDKVIWSKDGKNIYMAGALKQYKRHYFAQSSSITSCLNT